VDMQTRRFLVADGSVYLEGDCADTFTRTSNRICYCVAYDMKDLISAMRCYGPIAQFTS
jgi:hypothetical protein